jgi:hypothetical protein
MKNNSWIPEIMYEDDEGGMTSKIPFIMVPKEKEMPQMLFMFESRQTGEFEPGNDGEPLEIVEMELHQYADMVILKEGLDEQTYNKVRSCLGLDPFKTAVKKGRKITDNIRKNIQERNESNI